MKITASKCTQAPELVFPCLMINGTSGHIVLMVSESGRDLTGTSLHKGTCSYSTGYYSENWSKECFTVYDGEVTLAN